MFDGRVAKSVPMQNRCTSVLAWESTTCPQPTETGVLCSLRRHCGFLPGVILRPSPLDDFLSSRQLWGAQVSYEPECRTAGRKEPPACVFCAPLVCELDLAHVLAGLQRGALACDARCMGVDVLAVEVAFAVVDVIALALVVVVAVCGLRCGVCGLRFAIWGLRLFLLFSLCCWFIYCCSCCSCCSSCRSSCCSPCCSPCGSRCRSRCCSRCVRCCSCCCY